jgi:Tfp pilus assembly PilM family ATPase
MSTPTGRAISAIGLDVGRSRISAVQARRRAGTWRVFAAVEFDRLCDEGTPGPAEIARLSAVLSRQGFIGSDVLACTPEEHLVTSTLEAPPQVSGAPLGAMARMELSRSLRCRPDEIEVAWWNLPSTLRGKDAVHVLATAISHRDAQKFLDALESDGLNVVSLEPRVCALARACAPVLEDAAGLYAILEMGWDAACTVVAYRGQIIYGRSNAGGGLSSLARALKSDLNIDLELAEHQIFHRPAPRGAEGSEEDQEGPSGPGARTLRVSVARAVEEHLDAVSREVGSALSYACHRYPEAAVIQVIATGAGAGVPEIDAMLGARLEAPVLPVRPTDLVQFSGGQREACSNPGLCAALGLALWGLE